MFKYLKLSFPNTNVNQRCVDLNKCFFSMITNSFRKSKNKIIFENNNLVYIHNRNIFSKFFKKDKKEEEPTQNTIDVGNLKFLDKRGKFAENDRGRKVSDGEYNFSYNTELDNVNQNEDSQIEESNKNPEDSLQVTFSKEFLKIEEDSTKKKTNNKISEIIEDNNFNRIAKLIEFKVTFISQHLIKRYDALNFEEEIMPIIKGMRELGFDNNLLRSIFRKNFHFFSDKNNVEISKKRINYLEKSFNFSNNEAVDIVGCVPDIIKMSEEELTENYKFIKEYLELDPQKINKTILDFPSIITKTNRDAFNKVELYFNIYLNFEKKDLKNLVDVNPLLLNIEPDNTLEILKAVVNLSLNKEEFKEFLKTDSKLFLFKSNQFKNIFSFLKKYDIKSNDTFNMIKIYPELILANRSNLLVNKLKLLGDLIPQKSTLRSLIKTYPFIILKSYNSFVRKILYFNKELEKNILDLEIFPVIFVFNFNKEIKPRCEIMRKNNNWIPFKQAFSMTPEDFVKKMKCDISEYNSLVVDSSPLFERDLLYRYNKYYGI